MGNSYLVFCAFAFVQHTALAGVLSIAVFLGPTSPGMSSCLVFFPYPVYHDDQKNWLSVRPFSRMYLLPETSHDPLPE